MFFRFFNIPASFQSYINKILAKKLNIFVIVYLDNIFFYTKDPSQPYVNIIQWVLKELRKKNLFASLKKCHFHKDKIRFLGYILSAQRMQIEDKKIDKVKNWPELKFVQDIQVLLGFANFYFRFI